MKPRFDLNSVDTITNKFQDDIVELGSTLSHLEDDDMDTLDEEEEFPLVSMGEDSNINDNNDMNAMDANNSSFVDGIIGSFVELHDIVSIDSEGDGESDDDLSLMSNLVLDDC